MNTLIFFVFQTWYYATGGLVSPLIEKGIKFCLQGMIILGSVGELIIKIMKLNFLFFFINILVIISFCLSQCRKPNGRPSFNHMQRNSYSHTSKLAKSKDTNMPSSLAIWIAAWITSKLYIPYLITNHCNNRWISNYWMICFLEAMHYQ